MDVSNWSDWQTYRKDRGTPPWVKVYRNLLSNSEWAILTDSEKGQLVSIWLLAADKSGSIPDDARLIQKMTMLDNPPDINRFVALGFLTPTPESSGNHVVTICPQHDAPETETETETEVSLTLTAKPKKRFTPPSQYEVSNYMAERGFDNSPEADAFVDFYESKGWMVGKNKMKSWKAAVRNWLKRSEQNGRRAAPTATDFLNGQYGIRDAGTHVPESISERLERLGTERDNETMVAATARLPIIEN